MSGAKKATAPKPSRRMQNALSNRSLRPCFVGGVRLRKEVAAWLDVLGQEPANDFGDLLDGTITLADMRSAYAEELDAGQLGLLDEYIDELEEALAMHEAWTKKGEGKSGASTTLSDARARDAAAAGTPDMGALVTYSLGDVATANRHDHQALAHLAESLGVLEEDRELAAASIVDAVRELGRVRSALNANHQEADGFVVLQALEGERADEGGAA